MSINKLLIIMVMLFVIAGCQQTESPATPVYAEIEAATLVSGDSVPQPQDSVVLTVTGAISNTNVDDTLQFDMATLESLGVVEYRVNDKYSENPDRVFRGVLFQNLLDIAGASPDATTLFTVAINDYAVEIPLSDIRDYPVLIASMVDGERMSIEGYGPLRVVYPNLSFQFDESVYDQRWIWQLISIDVR